MLRRLAHDGHAGGVGLQLGDRLRLHLYLLAGLGIPEDGGNFAGDGSVGLVLRRFLECDQCPRAESQDHVTLAPRGDGDGSRILDGPEIRAVGLARHRDLPRRVTIVRHSEPALGPRALHRHAGEGSAGVPEDNVSGGERRRAEKYQDHCTAKCNPRRFLYIFSSHHAFFFCQTHFPTVALDAPI